MDLQSNLIESRKQRRSGGWQASLTSLVLHGVLVGSIIVVGATASNRINAEDKPIRAFIREAAAPPPPPPPPPPAASAGAPKATPRVEPVQPKPVHTAFIPPTEIPKDVPKVVETTPQPATNDAPSSNATPTPAVEGGVPGGVPGGVAGGVQGGVVGGEIGGVVGGQVGGVVGGVIGGQAGGTGTGTGEGDGAPKAEAPSGPLRVGGNVKAPVTIERSEPQYTDTARKAHVSGVVIVEAVIDKTGHVDQVRVLKGLPMGLSEAAEQAVRKWRFKPGTMNGEPVDVIFDLTVNFTLQ